MEYLLSYSIPSASIMMCHTVNDPHIAGAREMFVEMMTPKGDSMKAVATPIKFSKTRATVRTGPPKLGEHNETILKEILGLSEDQIAELREKIFGK